MIDHSRRVVHHAGAHNVRDLGGLPVRGGSTTFGRVFRGDFPVALAEASTAAEAGLPIETIVDLRRPSEARAERVDAARLGLRYITSTLIADRGSSWTAGYFDYLVDGPNQVLHAAHSIMAGAEHGVFFHCAAGKDRTGVMAALLLDVLGASHATITEDFLLTNDGIERVITRLKSLPVYDRVLSGRTVEQVRPQVDKMETFLEALQRKWSGAEGWLVGHGMAQETIDRFRALMVTPSPSASRSETGGR